LTAAGSPSPLVRAAALALALAPSAIAQERLAALDVTVRLAGRPAPDRLLRLARPGFAETAVTGADGRVVYFHLRPGSYHLELQRPAGEPSCAREIPLSLAAEASVVLDCDPPTEADAREPARPRAGSTAWSADDLRALPRPADPWSVLRDVPGVVVDRVDVAGSETGQQSLLVSHGDPGTGTTWTIDGFDVTDPAALGSTAVYPDMDALTELVAVTGTADTRVRTPGVQVQLELRAPADRFGGAAHLRFAPDGLQSDNLPADLAAHSFARSSTEHVLELGAEAGAPRDGGRLWLWGAFHRNALREQTFTGHAQEVRTYSITARVGGRLGNGALSLLALRSEKTQDDRDPTIGAAPEARWRQSGPTTLVALEDSRRLGRWSLLSRLGYMDAGFRLEPQGGSRESAFSSLGGVDERSYFTLETHRPRLQASFEAAKRPVFLGAVHDLELGAGYRLSRVGTDESWPGNSTQGQEEGGVFFRAFRLTGFAILYRSLSARSSQDQIETWAQDRARWGRLAVALGARLDRLSGHNRPSSVASNPEFPELLPAVSYAGDDARFRWLDLLPRISLGWSFDESLAIEARYAAYGAPLGTSTVVFDNPIGLGFGSISYYWIDRNRDGVVEHGDLDLLRGQLGTGGLDPDHPASTSSPNRIDPGLRSPRTHEAAGGVTWSQGGALRLRVEGGFRRKERALWSPFIGLTSADYAARGAVAGTLFGQPYSVVYFAPASTSQLVPGNGRLLTNREGYAEDTVTADVWAEGRLGKRLDWRVWGGFADWRERFFDRETAEQDPTPVDTEPLRDRGRAAVRATGLGRGNLFVSARWMAGAALRGRLPYGFEASALLSARDGFPIPYLQVADTGDPTNGAKSVLVATSLDDYRLPALFVLDLGLRRAFRLGRGSLTAAIDAFNVTNAATTLQVERDVEVPAFDRAREIVRPRILRLGLAYRF
jgi:hypothetical protein